MSAAAIHPEDVEGNLLADVRKKAARYDWLCANKAYVAVHPYYKDLPMSQRTGWTIRLVSGNDDSFEAAIDAAMTRGSEA